jgi:transcriptional regulator with XRE-family HTH domain
MSEPKSNRKFSFDARRAAVQKLREGYGLTQAALAQAANISQAKLSMFETGEQDLSEDAFMRVEEALIDAIAARKVQLATAERLLPLTSLRHAGPGTETEVKNDLVKTGSF